MASGIRFNSNTTAIWRTRGRFAVHEQKYDRERVNPSTQTRLHATYTSQEWFIFSSMTFVSSLVSDRASALHYLASRPHLVDVFQLPGCRELPHYCRDHRRSHPHRFFLLWAFLNPLTLTVAMWLVLV